ncbi:MAG: Type II secretion system protein D [Chlamydiae bacterium]|nr:Type II secretion system protein D [Chlamydiota bacterium]
MIWRQFIFVSVATAIGFTCFAEEVDEETITFIAETYLENPTQITPSKAKASPAEPENGYTVNFDDVPVTQLIRFISQISSTNFIFDNTDLKDLKITIVSEDSTTADDLMTALLQVLRMNSLSVVEQGNNVLIYKNSTLSKLSTIVSDANLEDAADSAVVTRVFRLYNITPTKVAEIVKPLVSRDAIVEVSTETRHLIISDITSNVDKVADLLNILDAPNIVLDVGEYDVQYAVPSVLVSYASEILAPLSMDTPVQLMAQPSTRKIYIVGTPYLLEKAIQVLASLDSPDIIDIIADLPPTAMANNTFQVYKLKYHDGKEIADALRAIGMNLQAGGSGNINLVTTINTIEWIDVNNSLVLSGTPDAVGKVIKLIDDLDTAPKQIYIEVLIIDTELANSLNFGVEWIALGNELNKLAFASSFLDTPPSTAPNQTLTGSSQAPLYGGARAAQTNPPPDASRGGAAGTGGDIPLTSQFQMGIIGNIIRHKGQSFLTLGALVTALEQEGNTTIVLNPRIMTEDTKEANIFVGQNIPYQTTSTIVRDTGSVTQNIQYEDVGIQLKVTPQVGPDNVVSLQLDQSISEVVSATTAVSSSAGESILLAPTTNKTLTTTRVHVPNDCFLVMSGHIRDKKTFSRSGIPCLGTLPWIGPAFSTTQESRDKRNLIMFIRPHVISTIREGVDLTNKEGYDANWNSNPCSIEECGEIERAPENETCPSWVPR